MFYAFCNGYAKLLNALIFVLGVVLLCAVGLQVLGRYVYFIPQYLWPQEVVNFSLIWAIFIGSILGVRENGHFNVDIFQYKGQTISRGLDIFLKLVHYVILASMIFVFIYYGWIYFSKWGMVQESEITGINLGWLYFAVPFTGVSWLLYFIEALLKEFQPKPAVLGRG